MATEGISVAKAKDIILMHETGLANDQVQLAVALREAVNNSWISDAGPRMHHGLYDHFKGGVYSSERVALWVEDGSPVVIYVSLANGATFVRKCSEWNEVVQWPDGKYRSRFVFRGVGCSQEPSFKVPTPK